MSSVYQRDRIRFVALVGAYVVSSLATIGAVLLVAVAAVRPPAVVVLDGERRARVVKNTNRPPFTREHVQGFARHFATAVAIEDGFAGPSQRERALEMMSVPLATYERSGERLKEAERHQAMLREKEISGHRISVNSRCRSPKPQQWVCIVEGEAGYRVGSTATPVVRKPFWVEMQVEALRITERSPYGLLVSAFKIHHRAYKARKAKGAGAR